MKVNDISQEEYFNTFEEIFIFEKEFKGHPFYTKEWQNQPINLKDHSSLLDILVKDMNRNLFLSKHQFSNGELLKLFEKTLMFFISELRKEKGG